MSILVCYGSLFIVMGIIESAQDAWRRYKDRRAWDERRRRMHHFEVEIY